ncbi:uncharacterized protein LOC114176770 isoform X2 [Vigna unguiculata]|uniref:uncharacterized protein LOC114176770 isoform X2 n=1 Tax=Vigna unguiculata TaxID=3917 RepID=UPI0010168304|nr:uncharacterized protein LOC114176770 isoform X2 [Vigna unguiculata]
MEFKFRDDGGNRSTSTTLLAHQRSLSTVPLVSGHHPLRGGFSGIIPAPPRMYPTPVPINSEEAIRQEIEREQIRREIEKEEIRREILAGERARRLELEEEVRRELASERALKMPIHRMEGITYGERGVSLTMIPGMTLHNSVNNNKLCGGPQPQLRPRLEIRQLYKQRPNETLTIKSNAALSVAKCKEMVDDDLSGVKHKEVINVNLGGVKRKRETPFLLDDNHSGTSLEKKPKKDWGCALCQIVTTSEKGLNDHLQGKKHKVKEASFTRKKGKSTTTTLSLQKSNQCEKSDKVVVTMNSGLDARKNGETLQSDMNPAYKGKVEPIEKDLAVEKSQDLGGTDNENEATTTEKEVQKSNATMKKFSFYCAFCEVRTHSEIVMQSHKSGKKHLANIRKHNNPNSSAGGACDAANSENSE